MRKIPNAILVIDGLDESSDVSTFLNSLINLLETSDIKMIILSCQEERFMSQLRPFVRCTFDTEKTESDILAFLQSELSKNLLLGQESARKVVQKCYGTDLANTMLHRTKGPFKWTTLALKELENIASTSEIIATVDGLPSVFTAFYAEILERYNQRFNPQRRQICSLVLRWIVCAVGPLSSEVLWAAIGSEYLDQIRESSKSTFLIIISSYPSPTSRNCVDHMS